MPSSERQFENPFSKLKRKLAIVKSKIEYYWFRITERINRVVEKETVHNSIGWTGLIDPISEKLILLIHLLE